MKIGQNKIQFFQQDSVKMCWMCSDFKCELKDNMQKSLEIGLWHCMAQYVILRKKQLCTWSHIKKPELLMADAIAIKCNVKNIQNTNETG